MEELLNINCSYSIYSTWVFHLLLYGFLTPTSIFTNFGLLSCSHWLYSLINTESIFVLYNSYCFIELAPNLREINEVEATTNYSSELRINECLADSNPTWLAGEKKYFVILRRIYFNSIRLNRIEQQKREEEIQKELEN